MLQFEYEQLPIIEKVDIYSQTEPDIIQVCTRLGHNIPLYKWKDKYFKITEECPKNIKELKNTIYYGTIGTSEAKQLLRFLKSNIKVASPCEPCNVYDTIHFCWQGFYDAVKLGYITHPN